MVNFRLDCTALSAVGGGLWVHVYHLKALFVPFQYLYVRLVGGLWVHIHHLKALFVPFQYLCVRLVVRFVVSVVSLFLE